LFIEDGLDAEGSPDISPSEVKSKGRPEEIGNEELLSNRNNLVVLLENTWGDVGWNLRHRVQTHSDVRPAFQVWEKEPILPYPARALLRPSEQASDAEQLSALHDERQKILDSISDAEKTRLRCTDLLEKARRALNTVSEDQRILVEEHVSERRGNLERTETTYLSLRKRLKEVEEQIKNSHGYLAQAEVLKFCTKGKYAFNPLNTANAIAGLPHIGYRRSIDRCREWKRIEGLPYRIFLILQCLCDRQSREITLVQHVEDCLRGRSPSRCVQQKKVAKGQRQRPLANFESMAEPTSAQIESYAVEQLQTKWYYLRRSIATALTAKNLLPEQVPYHITSEYFRRMAQPTNVDLLFEEDEQIIVEN
jgi:hypothetical protein